MPLKNRWMSVADPIHGIIQFDRLEETHRLLLDVINSKVFQRLRRIKQMGLAEFVFPNATHSRFVHSLGSTHLMIQTIQFLKRVDETKHTLESTYEDTGITYERLLLLGILIHDIGHTPLSHTLEDVLGLLENGLSHDTHWNARILREDDELNTVWNRYQPNLGNAVLDFMGQGERPKHYLASLISSQLDMDRLDYLQRDSHFLGVQYGRIEGQRIIGNLLIDVGPNARPLVAVREEAVPAVEHYLFGRHQAYKMALHSLDKASEALLKKTLERFAWARDNHVNTGNTAEALYQLIRQGHSLSLDDYIRLDDYYLWQAIHGWADDAEDPLLKTLANRLLRHDILKFVDLTKYGIYEAFDTLGPVYEAVEDYYHQHQLSMTFCLEETVVKTKPLYQKRPAKEPIWVKTANSVVDLAEVSTLPLGVASPQQEHERRLVFVWDKDAKYVLIKALEARYGKPGI
ncbi:MAG: hypothetical protein K2X01_04225 [Cyanobacteria bacterium]|nr:hypothetical protein [Cyanobacteriota bacterium]